MFYWSGNGACLTPQPAWTASPPPAPFGTAPGSPERGTGSPFLMAFAGLMVVTLVGRLFDYVLVGLHLPMLICGMVLVAGLLGGGVAALKSRPGILQLAFIVWMGVSTVFSSWKGGSAEYLVRFTFFSLTWLPLAAGPRSVRETGRLAFLVGLAGLLLLVFTSGTYAVELGAAMRATDRLGLEAGAYRNPADVGLIAGFAIPLCWLLPVRGRALRAALGLSATVFLLRTMALTGSRAALLGAGAMLAVLILHTPGLQRLALLVAAGLGAIVLAVTLPAHTLQRLGTTLDAFSGVSREAALTDEALLSALERREVLLDSLKITATHPVFGVGPGQFAEYRWKGARLEGIRKSYLVTHNSFTQVSSESGIPGMLLYVAFLAAIHRTLRIARGLNAPDAHPDWRLGRALAICLELSLVCFVVQAAFMSVPGYIFQFVIAGLALALERTSRLAAAPATPAATASWASTLAAGSRPAAPRPA